MFLFLVLPDDFSIHLSAFHSTNLYHEHIGYWSNVYGFEMNTIAKNILADGHVMTVPADDIMTSDCCIKVKTLNSLINKIKYLIRIWIFIHVQMKILVLHNRLLFKYLNPVLYQLFFVILM